ncbi:MAG: thymidine phosphorylase [bacterium]|nr:thymidine phosphorylase [bacterium]
MFSPYQFILKKRNGGEHTAQEIKEFISSYVAEKGVEPYQMSAWLMSVWFNGMTVPELSALTQAMVDSGDCIDLSSLPGVKVDKHSTGGVGDTTTLILAPLAAAAGATVAKMSGRGLGHTGGTLDKLESVPGLRTNLTIPEFLEQVRRIGVAVISQTGNLVPADGKMYALRDVTATVDSIPLIASSVMSKKIACGAECILLDVKYGRGAFMTNVKDARELARRMVDLGTHIGRKVRAVISDMDQPLGTLIGNALEVREAIEILRNERPGSALETVSVELASHLLQMAGICPDLDSSRKKIRELLVSGAGLRKLGEMFSAQGGNGEVVNDVKLLPQASIMEPVPAPRSGYVTSIHAQKIGFASTALGAGRMRKEDSIDPAVGLEMTHRVGSKIEKGEPLAILHVNKPETIEAAKKFILEAITIGDEQVEPRKLIEEVVE